MLLPLPEHFAVAQFVAEVVTGRVATAKTHSGRGYTGAQSTPIGSESPQEVFFLANLK